MSNTNRKPADHLRSASELEQDKILSINQQLDAIEKVLKEEGIELTSSDEMDTKTAELAAELGAKTEAQVEAEFKQKLEDSDMNLEELILPGDHDQEADINQPEPSDEKVPETLDDFLYMDEDIND